VSDNVPEGATGPGGAVGPDNPGRDTGEGDTGEGDTGDGDTDATSVRRALDILLFAPVGVALTVAEDLPALIVKGRKRFEDDIRNARIIGKFVVTHGQRDITERVGKLLHSDRAAPAADAPDAPSSPEGSVTPFPPAASARPAPDPADGVIVDEALAGYDTLSASQVVRRLESLEFEQLRAVHRHEASHRNRRTILNRAHQLLEAANANASPEPASANGIADAGNGESNHAGAPSGTPTAQPDYPAE
jgi:hypothetical protein